MFKDEEEKLKQWKESIEQTEIPFVKLEQAIGYGYNRAKNEKNNRKRRIQKQSFLSIAAAALLFLALITSIRVSPAFAQAMASIPGMEKLVELVSDNKGLQAAIQNDYYQPVGITETKDGISVTLDGIIGDSSAMVLFYTIDSYTISDSDHIDGVHVVAQNGEKLPWGSIGTNHHGNNQLIGSYISTVHWQEEPTTEEMIFQLKIKNGGSVLSFDVPFTYQNPDVESKVFELNKTVEVKDQKITIERITINPVHTEINVKFDPKNKMKIFRFEDLRIVNQMGETWTSIQNGVTASHISDDEITFYLQSNYFDEPKNLSLQFSKLMALDKDQAELVIDTDRKEILKQPDDQRYELVDIGKGGEAGEKKVIRFKFRTGYDKYFSHNPFNVMEDANGKEWSGFTTSHLFGDVYEEWGLELPDQQFANPLTFKLSAHPNWIEGDIKIKLK